MAPPARCDSHESRVDEHTLAVIELTAQRVVKEHAASCPYADVVHNLRLDVYGIPGDKDNEGIKAQVKDLQHSRNILKWGLRAAWAALLAGVGILFGKS